MPGADEQESLHHFGGTYTNAVINHLRETLGPEGLSDVLMRAGERRSLDALLDYESWSSYEQFRRLLEAAAEVAGLQILSAAGRHLFDLSDFERNPAAVQALGSPEVLYANADSAGGMVCPILGSDPREVGERDWVITQSFVPGFEAFPEHCAFQIGVLQFTTMMFGYGPADVVEETCACRGDSACVFRIQWEEVREADRDDFLNRRVQTLEVQLERFESTVADLVSGPDLQTIVERTFESASGALLAPMSLLVLDAIPQSVKRLYVKGMTGEQAEAVAAQLASAADTADGERLVANVISARGRYGRIAVIRPGGGFLPKEFSRLQAYASFLAAALDSAASIEEARRQEADAHRQRDTARALLQLSDALAEVTSAQEMAAKLVRAVPKVMGSDRAIVVLAEGDRKQARIVATEGYSDDIDRLLRQQQLPIPELADVGVGIVQESRDSDFTTFGRDIMERTGTVGATVVPIVVDGEWAGAIVASVVAGADRLESSPDNEVRLRALAAQASTAIRNSRLLDQVRHQALHDPLTGLPNRALILDRVEQMLARARRNKHAAAAMFVDLDGFKDINDTFGHAAGDELLRLVTARLQAALRPSDTVGRLGGDEFVVLVDGASLDAGPELVAERILTVLREPFDIAGAVTGPLPITASIGIAAGDRDSPGDLLRDADIALYKAKESGKNQFCVFEAQMQTTIQDRLLLQMELREALQQERFFLVYQPICELATGQITSVEALLRWSHPTRGEVQPNDFIPLLEESGLIVEVGRWVLHQACQQAAKWHRMGLGIGVAVNISGRQLQNDSFPGDVKQALSESGLEPGSLVLEITESTMIADVQATAARLRVVKALGVRIAVDDFGTGYSSLSVLRDFPVDTLKIDRTFVATLGRSKDSSALIHTFVQLGKTLGLSTLAEGIEEPGQYTHLQGEECESGQGFLIARPMLPEAVESLLIAAPAI